MVEQRAFAVADVSQPVQEIREQLGMVNVNLGRLINPLWNAAVVR